MIFYCVLGLFVLIAGGFFLMSYLMEEVKDINRIKIENINKYRAMFEQNQILKEQIKSRSLELIEVGKRVEDLEDIVDFSKNKDTLSKDVDFSGLNTQDQLFLLQIIPNGHPLKNFQKIIPIKERLHPLKNRFGVNSGIDYLTPSHTPVYATADGIIEISKTRTSLGGYGRFVKISHAYGFSSMYAHLSKVLVHKGEFVKKGQLIGYSGRSGASDGERLYYEIRFLGGYQNAFAFVQWSKEDFGSIFKHSSHIDWNRLLWAIEDLKTLQTYQERTN